MAKLGPQFSAQLKEELEQLKHSRITAVYDPTRIYEYGARIYVGWEGSWGSTINDMKTWCNSTYGPKPYAEYYAERWQHSANTFWFKDEQDRTMFMLRFA